MSQTTLKPIRSEPIALHRGALTSYATLRVRRGEVRGYVAHVFIADVAHYIGIGDTIAKAIREAVEDCTSHGYTVQRAADKMPLPSRR